MSAQRMSNADAAWLHMDRPTNLMVVNSVLWFDEPVDLIRTREVIAHRWSNASAISSARRGGSPGLGLPTWEDDPNFELDRHIHHLTLRRPGDRRTLEALVSDLMMSPLDRTKPLWDTYLIDGYGEGMALVTRMHHCIADGIALSRLLLSLTDSAPDAGIAPPRRSVRTVRCLTRWSLPSEPEHISPKPDCTRDSRSSRIPPTSFQGWPPAPARMRARSPSCC